MNIFAWLLHWSLIGGFLLFFPQLGWGQNQSSLSVPGQISGSFQSDVQYLFPDSLIGAEAVDEKVLSNSYLQLTYRRDNFSAGIRYEAYLNPLLGFDPRYQGQGIANRYASYETDKIGITVGNFYDQFGNGIVFRAYQEWALGIDNSVDGLRVRLNLFPGLTLKGIIGKQRKFFELSEGLLRGADADLDLNQAIPAWKGKQTRLRIGGSVMNRFQADDDPRLQLPENVSAFSGRIGLGHKGLDLKAEYAYKINDPFSLNNFSYNPGTALYLDASYARKGLGINFSAHRIDNFDFRSERDVTLQELTISYLPPATRLHTYRLPTLYPYATQFFGELGFQASILYTIPKKTKLGGKYGTQVRINYSRISSPDTTLTASGFRYENSLLGDQDYLYFQDINIELNRKWSRKLRSTLTYINLTYNKNIIEFSARNAGQDSVQAHIGILELQYRIKPKVALRTEAQVMYVADQKDLGSWAMLLAELSFSPNWFITVFDEYNFGNPDPDRRVHYYNASVSYAFGANRVALSYSRQRRGLLCVGGICREVPASNGFGLALNSTF
jgi:GNAT superfamily N-acetyltransferase